MCDYSLMHYRNRLANVGEKLITTSFPSGTMGFTAAPASIPTASAGKRLLSWATQRKRVAPQPAKTELCAVCLPEGSRLQIADISPQLQAQLNVGPIEEVKVVQLSGEVFSYRDAIEFSHGRRVSLQDLPPGMTADVLSVESESTEAATEIDQEDPVAVG